MLDKQYVVRESRRRTRVPAGQYPAKLVDYSKKEGEKNGIKWETIELQFEILSPEEYAGKRVTRWFNLGGITEDYKICVWLGVILDKVVTAGEILNENLDEALGKQVVVKVKDRVDPKTRRIYSEMDAVFPIDDAYEIEADVEEMAA